MHGKLVLSQSRSIVLLRNRFCMIFWLIAALTNSLRSPPTEVTPAAAGWGLILGVSATVRLKRRGLILGSGSISLTHYWAGHPALAGRPVSMTYCSVKSAAAPPLTVIFLDCVFLPSCQAVMM